jgi:hypothetical protein
VFLEEQVADGRARECEMAAIEHEMVPSLDQLWG